MDIHLSFEERGSGTPLILLHGNGENSGYFKYQLDFFAPHYRVIAIDTRGHGKSPLGEAPFTLVQFAEDLKAFMDALGMQKAHILGFSDGGNIALLFALHYPEMVDRLVLNGANLNPKGVKAAVQIPFCVDYAVASFRFLCGKKSAVKKKKELLGLMVSQPNIKTAELAALDMPVLVIAGTNDMIKESHTREIASAIPNAELCIMTGDHFVARRNSGPFNQTVLEFLQKNWEKGKD